MFQYLKDRFKEYMSLEKSNTHKEIIVATSTHTEEDDEYIDYDIYYGGTTIIIDTFSIPKEDMKRNLKQALITNIADVLEVSIFHIKLVSCDLNTIICDVTYSGKTNEYIRHEIKKVEEHKVSFDKEFEPDEDVIGDSFNPYESTGWSKTQWHCMRCGEPLLPIAKDDKEWDYTWELMKADGTQWFLCSNIKCEDHHDTPLVLHHPYNTHTEAGESYSLSHLL